MQDSWDNTRDVSQLIRAAKQRDDEMASAAAGPGELPRGGKKLAAFSTDSQATRAEWSCLATRMGPESFLGAGLQIQCDSQSHRQVLGELGEEQAADNRAKPPALVSAPFSSLLQPLSAGHAALHSGSRAELLCFGVVRALQSFGSKNNNKICS